MLKIERRSRDLTIRLRETKARLLSRPLTFALAIALLLHLSTLVLFRFPVFQPKYSPANHVLTVHTEPLDGQLIATIDPEPYSGPDSLLPRTSAPQARIDLKSPRILPHTISASDLFSAIETPLVSPTLHLPNTNDTPRIYISGPLAEYPVDQTTALTIAQTFSQGGRVRFAVEVNAQEGKIHWWEPLDQNEKEIYQAERLLETLVFSIPNRAALIPGEVEIVLP